MIDYQYKKALLHHKRGAFLVQKPFFKKKLKKGQYFLNITLQPITFATPR
jgi:hypothetical protein